MNNISKEKHDLSNSIIHEGENMFRKGDFNGALKCFKKVLSNDKKNWQALNFKGCCLLKLNQISEAKYCFEESLKIDNSRSESWGCLGTYYFSIKDYDEADNCFYHAENLDGNELTYSQLAYYFYCTEDFEKANSYVKQTLSFNELNESALNTKGLLYISDKDFTSAINTFHNLIAINSSNSFYHCNLGYALLLNGNISEAKNALDLSITLDRKNAYALNNLAILFHSQSNYLKAWNYIKRAVAINSEVEKFWENKADILISLIKSGNDSLGSLQDVGYFFYRANHSTVDLLIGLNSTDIELSEDEKNQIILGIINRDNYFTETTINCVVNREEYIKIYRMSLEIVALLNTTNANEFQFAHYTTQDTANALIFENSPFRLNSVTTANDPKEGYPLLNFFGFDGVYTHNIYQALVGSFTFNPDSLNQFRLYGKNNNIEGTGVSLILSYQYFSEKADLNRNLTKPPAKDSALKSAKQPLFRCIYIDPSSRRVISLGHKEACVFYRENIGEKREIVDEKVNNYLNFINNLKITIEDSLVNLNQEISILFNKIDDHNQRNEIIKIIPMLLIHLRYLVKHYDFKEEQECRIIQVEPLFKNPYIKITGDNNRMYVDYLPLHNRDKSYLNEIYWGPKTSNFELFKDRVTYLGINIFCYKKEHPFV